MTDDTTNVLDIETAIAPKSDQLNADDLMIGPRTVTVTALRQGPPDQPWHIMTDAYGPGRPYKPCKTMRRVIAAVWGKDSRKWVGQSMTLYRDETVVFGKAEVGGIRISHMTGIDQPRKMSVTVKRGARGRLVIKPLTPDNTARPDGPEPITTAQKAKIKENMGRTGLTWADVTITASHTIGRTLSGPSDIGHLTHDEADALITELAETPDQHPEDSVTMPAPEDAHAGAVQ